MKSVPVIFRAVLLLVSGTLLIVVGAFILVSPGAFYIMNDIDIGANVNLLSELKAPAGLLLTAGVFIVCATFVRNLADTALGLAALVYLSYAVSRTASMVYDGVPVPGLVQAAALEGIVGLACLATLLICRMSSWKTV